MSSYECFDCKKVTLLMWGDVTTCPSCGSSNGQIIDKKKVDEGLEAGAYFNIDPKTGKPAKKK